MGTVNRPTAMPSNLKNLQSNIICTKVEHHLYKSRTSFVQKSNIICTKVEHHLYKSRTSFVQKSNIICTKVEHHLYKSRTSFVQKSNIICTNWGFFRIVVHERRVECELT